MIQHIDQLSINSIARDQEQIDSYTKEKQRNRSWNQIENHEYKIEQKQEFEVNDREDVILERFTLEGGCNNALQRV